MEAMVPERDYSYGKDVKYLTLQEYILFRDRVSGAVPTVDLVEISMGVVLPPSIIEHPVIKALRLCAARIIAWSNDCFSVKKILKDAKPPTWFWLFKMNEAVRYGKPVTGPINYMIQL